MASFPSESLTPLVTLGRPLQLVLETSIVVTPVHRLRLGYADLSLIDEHVNGRDDYLYLKRYQSVKSKTDSSSRIIPAPNIKLKDEFNKE
ncbi:hypothetical protein TNCV_825111 [Trichonephila clavipes]|nr:hypothetical protein TNCV_825111 [Trichonephila clavipes]